MECVHDDEHDCIGDVLFHERCAIERCQRNGGSTEGIEHILLASRPLHGILGDLIQGEESGRHSKINGANKYTNRQKNKPTSK